MHAALKSAVRKGKICVGPEQNLYS
jgi:hypothetical protein